SRVYSKMDMFVCILILEMLYPVDSAVANQTFSLFIFCPVKFATKIASARLLLFWFEHAKCSEPVNFATKLRHSTSSFQGTSIVLYLTKKKKRPESVCIWSRDMFFTLDLLNEMKWTRIHQCYIYFPLQTYLIHDITFLCKDIVVVYICVSGTFLLADEANLRLKQENMILSLYHFVNMFKGGSTFFQRGIAS
ncbi:hypothetical protein ACJX0J_019368, partial [Zea mays]